MDVLAAARRYHADGLAVTPVHGKKPWLPKWQKQRLPPDEFATHFRAGVNVGVLNGAMSGGLVDVDLDAPEALAVADAFLPDTALCFGRPSAPRSHRLYRCTPPPGTTPIMNPDGDMLIELRSDGSQTVWPPSTHAPSGERVAFEAKGEPSVVDASALLACVEQTAACALLAQRWPKEVGSRHAVANAAAGYLLLGGVPEDIARKLVRLAAWAAGDEEYRDRGRDVGATAKALASGKTVTSGATLANLVGHEVVSRLGAWLHFSAPRAETKGATATPIIARLSDVEPEQVRWLDTGRIPLGKVTVIDGDPGLGKSTAVLDYAARVSTGAAMPDGSRGDLEGSQGVVILSAEDGLADTIRPRLDAAGADCSRIVALTAMRTATGDDRLVTLDDVAAIEAAIRQVGARLVIVDPLMAYLPGAKNAHRDQDVRIVLSALAKLAERTGCAIVVVRHLNKTVLTGNPLYRGGGSIGIIAAARSGLLVGRDPEDETGARRILVSTKCNLAIPPAALAYRLESTLNGVARVVWEGPVDCDARQLLDDEGGALTKRDRAKDFLRDLLSDGPIRATEVFASAKAEGLSERTVNRAKAELRIRAERQSEGHWTWSLQRAKPSPKAEAQITPPKTPAHPAAPRTLRTKARTLKPGRRRSTASGDGGGLL